MVRERVAFRLGAVGGGATAVPKTLALGVELTLSALDQLPLAVYMHEHMHPCEGGHHVATTVIVA